MSESTAAGAAASPLSDEEVVRRVRAGDVDLFEVLMRRYNQRLYRVARSILRDEGEAEDVMQQAYVNAYLHLEQFADRARFATWLTRIAVYEALGRLRRRRRAREVAVCPDEEAEVRVPESAEPGPERQAQAAELRRLLEAAIDTLPGASRATFVMREVEGLSTAETAESLGVSEDVVKTRLSRARRLLRRELYDRAGLVRQDAFAFHASRCDRVVSAVFRTLRLPERAH